MKPPHYPFKVTALKRFLLSVLLGLLVVACNDTEGYQQIENKFNQNILRFDIHSPIGSLHPIEASHGGANQTLPFLYSYLFIPNLQSELEPDLALEWSYNAQSLTWTIKLRPDARFHNGKKVAAQDVTFSLEKHVSRVKSGLSGTIDKFISASPGVIKIHLKKRAPYLLQKIWNVEIIPMTENAGIDYYNRPVGSGPYQYISRQGNQSVTLKTNPDYYGGKPAIDKVVFYFVPDKERTWTRLLRGETDIAAEIRLKHYHMMAHIKEKFTFYRQLHKHYTIMLFNTHDPLFADKRVRQALAHAVDRDYIIEKILLGAGETANGPMGVNSPFHNPEAAYFAYNPDKCQRLLKQAGWMINGVDNRLYRDGKPFQFIINYIEGITIDERVARYIKLCLAEIGIEAHIIPLKYDILRKRYYKETRFQAVITEISGIYHLAERLKRIWDSSPQDKSQAGCFYHHKVNAVIDKAIKENEPTKRKELLYQAEALIIDLQPGIFLFHEAFVDVISKRIHLPHPFSLDYAGISRLRHATTR